MTDLQKYFQEPILSTTDASTGCDQKVTIITTGTAKYVVKQPRTKEHLYREVEGLRLLEGKNLPVPQILRATKSLCIQTYLEGEHLSKAYLNSTNKKNIFEQIGKYLREIHTIKLTKFGPLVPPRQGKYDSLWDFAVGNNLHFFQDFKPLLLEKEYEKFKSLLARENSVWKTEESVLLHYDYDFHNLKVKHGTISAIIDFADSACGPAMFDLARLRINLSDEDFSAVANGYGNINRSELRAFCLSSYLWMIPYHKHNDHTEWNIMLGQLKRLLQTDM